MEDRVVQRPKVTMEKQIIEKQVTVKVRGGAAEDLTLGQRVPFGEGRSSRSRSPSR
jgi:hypothetical protein